jgi:hypothetical protein
MSFARSIAMSRRARLASVVAVLGSLTVLFAGSYGGASTSLPDSSVPQNTPRADEAVRCGIDMRNLLLNVAEGIVLRVRTLDGELIARAPNTPPVFDDPSSYTLRVKTAEMTIDAASLNVLMARVFSGASPIKDLKVTIANGEIQQRGKLHKGVDVPFSMKTSVSTTADGRLRLHATSLKAIGIPVKGMLDVFGVDLDNLMKMPGQRGIQVEGDDILLSPAEILPPPATQGRVSAVRIVGDRLELSMVGDAKPPARPSTLPDPSARNYVYFHGGNIRFGKLTMSGADLQLVDADPSDPFDFFPEHYLAQLVAGYSRTIPRGGLKVMMPDYGDLKTARGRVKTPVK